MKLLFTFILGLTLASGTAFSQLVAGDIAFIGYNTDGTDDFAFITLTDIPGSEVIYLTEEGWNSITGTWAAGTTETHLVFTAPPGGLPCGTVVHINETGPDVFTIGCSVPGSTISVGSGSSYTLSGGDQILAYQAASPEPATTPTFIAGVHGDDGNGSPLTLDPVTGWNDLCCTAPGVARSSLPAGLTNGVNCVSLFPEIGTELDNAKYSGTLVGTSTALRAAINDRTNWSTNDVTPFDITFSSYSPSVTCVAPCSNPTIPTISYSPMIFCEGESVTLTLTGTLNDATAWHIYTGSCGGTEIGSTAGGSFDVTPGAPSTTYYIRGEGGCVIPGSCGSILVTVTPEDDASFTYDASSYCPYGSDATPTIAFPGGTFTFDPAGLVIDGTTGTIDLLTSPLNTYTITYTTGGDCPGSFEQTIAIEDNEAPAPVLATLPILTDECEILFLDNPEITDNCDGILSVDYDVTLPINTQGTTTITWTYTDEFGNSSTQTQDVVINDITAPIPDISPLPDYMTSCSLDELTPPTATDNCGGTITITNDGIFPITAPTTVTWTYDDGNGNTTTQTQNIIFAPIDVSITISDGITINASNTDADGYQWVNCTDYGAIPGATEPSFTPSENGAYAVIISEGPCSDTSECALITQVGIESFGDQQLIIYPNPTQGNFITIESTVEIIHVSILDLSGRKIGSDLYTKMNQVDISALESGNYIIHIELTNGNSVKRTLVIMN